MTKLGEFKKVTDIRQIWTHEANDFTPWLGEHIHLLSEALGLGHDGLEYVDREVPVGAYFADILANDITKAKPETVLIENQFGRTDHDHFGKLMTYASGLKASTVILVCERVREEHRTAMTWLNTITDDQTNFFAVELALWRIDDSPIAPQFNVVVQPDNWGRIAENSKRAEASGELSELKKMYLGYWGKFREYFITMTELVDDLPLRPRKPLAQQWTGFSIGRTNVEINVAVNSRDQWIKSELTLHGPKARTWHQELYLQKPAIESEIGYALDWTKLDGSQQRICITKVNTDPENQLNWDEQHDWMYGRVKDLHHVFATRVKELS